MGTTTLSSPPSPPPRRAAVALSLLLLGLAGGRGARLAAVAPPAVSVDGAIAAGGAGEATFYESIDVDVVDVEVVASDRTGRPVAGLTRDDFELFEDGKRVALSNFLSSVEAALAAGHPVGGRELAPAVRSADQALSFAVFVDNENLTATARRPVLGALDTFLRSHVGPGDHVILARYDGGMKVSQPRAGDPAAITAAMRQLMTDTTHGGLAVEDQQRILRAQADLAEGGALDDVIEAGELGEDAQLAGEIDVQRGKRGLAALANFITSLSGLPGRKALVVVTGAFAVDADPLIAHLAEHANANRVTVYVLGAVEPPVASAFRSPTRTGDNPFAAVDALTDALHVVADHTGGLTAANLNDPLSFLEQVRADVNTYYSLGFTPEHPRDGKLHRLAVKVKGRSDLTLRYRSTYGDRSSDQRVTSETLSALLLGVGENPLGVRISFEPPAAGPAAGKNPANGEATLPVIVHVPLEKLVLVPQEHFHEGRLTFLVATRDERGRILLVRRLAAPVRVGNDRLLGVRGQSVDYRLEIPLHPGELTLAVGVRDEIGHLDSTASTPLGEAPGGASPASSAEARRELD
jgi:VWFA-related protein